WRRWCGSRWPIPTCPRRSRSRRRCNVLVQMEYAGRSAIVNGLRDARVVFAANRLREPTFFRGDLAQPVLFREALATLYRVVVSDYKYRPRDRLEFRAWL